MHRHDVVPIYERFASEYDSDRDRSLFERPWLDRFLRHVPRRGTVLDLGCGMGEPIAAYFLSCGFSVVGVDSSPSLIARCRERFPESEWLVADMRRLDLGRRFDGIVAWDSFFHLPQDDQRAMFSRFRDHAKPAAPLLFTSGPREGVAIGSYQGQPLHHASLDPAEYERLLNDHEYTVEAHVAEDPDCGGHTVWLAIRDDEND